jgi:hypothetical protein
MVLGVKAALEKSGNPAGTIIEGSTAATGKKGS